jgi:predicted RNA-binding protein
MCDLNVILLHGDSREQVMDSVTRIVVDGDSIELTGILGEQKTVTGFIKEINISSTEAIIVAK